MRALLQVSDWPVDCAAVAVVTADGMRHSVGPLDDPFEWASVTKLVSALTVLDTIDEGLLDLDEDAGPPGATVRHLLAHASGLGFDDDKVHAKPGRRRIYSNSGYELLGELVEERTGQPFAERLQARVLGPLGMQGTRLDGSPAHGASGSLRDLVTLGRELLAPTLLGADRMREATTVEFPGLAGVLPGFGRQDPNDWGLGFEIRDGKSPHWTGSRNSPATFGHFGQSGSFLWVDPDAGVACAALADRDFGPWAAEAWPALADALLGEAGV
jgi:CubicO group peptidase (beta-lactamase class C family)